jgi:hypothetical protein
MVIASLYRESHVGEMTIWALFPPQAAFTAG